MKINPVEARKLFLATVFLAGLGLATHAPAQERTPYLVDLNAGTARPLGTLGGNWSEAYALNDVGQVVGASPTADGYPHAFITGPDGAGVRDLGTLGGVESRPKWHQRCRTGGRVLRDGRWPFSCLHHWA